MASGGIKKNHYLHAYSACHHQCHCNHYGHTFFPLVFTVMAIYKWASPINLPPFIKRFNDKVNQITDCQ